MRRAFKLEGVRLRVDHPRIIGVHEDIAFSVSLKNDSKRDHLELRVSGPLLPWDGSYLSKPPTIKRLRKAATEVASVKARFVARGEHHLDPFVASALVPFSMTEGPTLSTKGLRFTVVPRIAPIESLYLPTGQRYQPGGVALASRTGESMEIIGLRPYYPGDPVRDLHPLRWARLGYPVVREYQQEYFTRLGVIVDTDATGVSERCFEAALSLSAGVIAHLTRGEALIDLLVVGLELHRVTLGRSLGHLEQALELLGRVAPGPRFDADTLSRRMAPFIGQLSAVVFVSLDWDIPRRELVTNIRRGAVGCRTLWVTDDPLHEVREADLDLIPSATIESGEGLQL